MAAMTEEFVFQIADIKFSKEGFHIVRTTNGDSAAGKFAARIGHCYKADGVWDRTSDKAKIYGATFKIESAVAVRMTSADALGRFLTLQLKGKGVGESVIGSLVEACKDENLDMEALLDKCQRDILVECVGSRNAKKVDILLAIWPSIKPAADLMSPLLGYGLSEAQAESMVALYGKNAVERVEDFPYELILCLDGVSFITADKIAMKVGRVQKTDPVRLRAALATGMRDATSNGDIGVRRKTLLDKTIPLVNESVLEGGKRKLVPGVPLSVTYELLAQVLDDMINGKYTDADGIECAFSSNLLEFPDAKGEVVVWFKPLVMAEKAIATRMATFKAAPRHDLVARIPDVAAAMGAKLAPEQLQAIEWALLNPFSVITGGPGCGKSFLLKVLLALFDLGGLKGSQAAPTGKAAKRISESTGRAAQTQHSLIGYQPGGRCMYNPDNPLSSQYLVIDESSMDDVELLAATLLAVTDNCRIIMVGDVDQLASVGPGQCLRDIINSGRVPVTRLVKGFRFSGGIAAAARAVNRGIVPESSDDNQFVVVETDNPAQEAMAVVRQLLAEGANEDDIQILSPTHKGDAGCNAMNKAMQSLLNPEPAGGTNQKLRRDSGDILVGDRVLQGKNDKELGLVNGDIGWVVGMSSDKGCVSLQLVDKPKPIEMESSKTNHLKLAYAITVHKSQGAEAPYVLLVLDKGATFMLRRNLAYTGISRGSKRVFVFTDHNTFASAVRRGEPPEGSRRTTLLSQLEIAFAGRPRPVVVAPTSAPVDELAAAMLDDVELDVSI